MQTLTERIETIEIELADVVARAKQDPTMRDEIGRLSMSQYFLRRVVEDRQRRQRRIVPSGGIDHSLPAGDRN